MLNKKKTSKNLEESMAQIQDNIKLFKSGKHYAYKGIAIQLRLLLCDKTTKPLLLKIFSAIAFHPLKIEVFRQTLSEKDRSSLIFAMSGTAHISPKGSELSDIFDKRGTPMMLEEWLNQKIILPNISIRDLILSTANKEAAHSDSDYNETLKTSKSINLGAEEMQGHYIIAIGEYVHEVITDVLTQKTKEFEKWKES